jgi:hypothetical protein
VNNRKRRALDSEINISNIINSKQHKSEIVCNKNMFTLNQTNNNNNKRNICNDNCYYSHNPYHFSIHNNNNNNNNNNFMNYSNFAECASSGEIFQTKNNLSSIINLNLNEQLRNNINNQYHNVNSNNFIQVINN